MALPTSQDSPLSPAGAPRAMVEGPVYSAPAASAFDLRELFDILLRGKWTILIATLLIAVPVAVMSALQPSLYRSYALLLIDKQNTSLADVLPDQPAAAFFRRERNLGNELLVLNQSLPLAEDVAAQLIQMKTVPGTDRPISLLSGVGLGPDGQPVETDSSLTVREVALKLQRGLVVANQETADADAIRVSAVSTVPEEAEVIANAYAEAFVRMTRESSREGVSASREFLEEQVGDRGTDLERLDQEMQSYMMREGAVALDQETSQLVNQIAELQARRDAASVRVRTQQASIAALQGERARLESQLSGRLSSGLDARLEALQARVREIEAELQPFYTANPELREDASPVPRVAQLEGELNAAQAELRTVSNRLSAQSLGSGSGPGDNSSGFARASALREQISQARVQLSAAVAERDQLSSRMAQYESELNSIPRQSIELAQLQRERMAAEQLYGALESNLQEARVAEQSQLGYARMIRPALEASNPFSPRRGWNILLSTLFGLVAGSVLAIARVRLDHRINRPDDVRDLGVPLLATIPNTDDLIKRDFEGRESTNVDGREVDNHVVTLLNPMAAASEAYRALRTAVQFSRPDVVVETILVTSSNPSEGKSVTAANLAVTIAQAGRRVLLVDADLRKPTAHRKMGLPREPGLVQRLFGEVPVAPEYVPQVADDLHLLTAGTIAPNPSELIGSRRMRELIDEMKTHYDVIIFDAPPVLAATDAVLLSTQCDATLVVVRAGRTKDYDLDTSLEALQSVGASVIGTVLNGFDITQAYGYRYKYAYRYGSDYAYGSDKA